VLNGQKSWITNAGVSEYYTVMAVTDPESGPRGSRPSSSTGDEGLLASGKEKQARDQGLADA
jgi:alkylation response protein AidB-like acyl-CoA dehydrogenase